jgi:predicted acetyltransferase
MNMAERLEIERKVFDARVEEWRFSHMGKFVLIQGKEIIGFYDSLDKAFSHGTKLYGMADFFIEQILPVEMVNVSFIGQVA